MDESILQVPPCIKVACSWETGTSVVPSLGNVVIKFESQFRISKLGSHFTFNLKCIGVFRFAAGKNVFRKPNVFKTSDCKEKKIDVEIKTKNKIYLL